VFSFTRASGEIEHYIPFFNEKRVIALHAAADLSFHNRDQVVPFYMQPTLGGPTTLRGFRFLRFYDENAVVANAEYRWEIFTGFDMAIFADAGEVFNRPSQFSLSYVKSDMGLGLRFNNQRNLVMRIDTGVSKEGFQVWFSFNKVF
jgi:outer membrane protein assembly factor BamA